MVKNCPWNCVRRKKAERDVKDLSLDIGLEKIMKGSSIDGDDWYLYGKYNP